MKISVSKMPKYPVMHILTKQLHALAELRVVGTDPAL